MGDKLMYRKLDAVRVILARVQNGTDLCFRMQGSRDIRFDSILFVVKKAFVFGSTRKTYQSKQKHAVNWGLENSLGFKISKFQSLPCHQLFVAVILPCYDLLYPFLRLGWLNPLLLQNISFHWSFPCLVLTPSQHLQAINTSHRESAQQRQQSSLVGNKSLQWASAFIRINTRALFQASFL